MGMIDFHEVKYHDGEMDSERAKMFASDLLWQLQQGCQHLTSSHEEDMIVCFDCGITLGKHYPEVVCYVDDDPDGEGRTQYTFTIYDDRFYGVKSHA